MKKSQSSNQTSIHDIYVLVEVSGKKVKGKITKQSTLELNLTTMKMMGNDGCNDFSGAIKKHDSDKMELEFGDIVATEMYCDELSNKVGNFFRQVKKYKRENMQLTLFSEKGEQLLLYNKVD